VSAQWRDPPADRAVGAPVLLPMTTRQLDAVMAIELAAYPFPWTRGNFIDSIAAGHVARLLVDAATRPFGYFIAMQGVDEMHLLNLAVAPTHQGRGHARYMLQALFAVCRERALQSVWLEVRASNQRARSMYARQGFVEVGLRKSYYPAAGGRREDAVVMSLAIAPEAPAPHRGRSGDALE
jgi:ribosomal-protein-alanine N-acetyltransferase